MSDYDKALNKAALLERRAKLIREKAFNARKLPDRWRVGQLVRMLKHQEWSWSRGDIMKVCHVPYPDVPAAETLSFYVAPRRNPLQMRFYCTSYDVELFQDVSDPVKSEGK